MYEAIRDSLRLKSACGRKASPGRSGTACERPGANTWRLGHAWSRREWPQSRR